MTISHVGVILMTYGSPATLDDIPVYLQNVRGGRAADEALITEFRRRYDLIGGSPLLRITREQAAMLQDELNRQHPDGPLFHVDAGMRFAPPFIADVVPEVAAGAQELIGVIMSPQFSPIIMSAYVRTLQDAASGLQRDDLQLKIAGAGRTRAAGSQSLPA
jgi:ferrochelatase